MLILGEDTDPETYAAMAAELGLDKPFFVQYFNYIISAVQGDFGFSWITKIPVFDEILARFPTTLWLTIGAICLKVIIGVPIAAVLYEIIKKQSALRIEARAIEAQNEDTH